MRSNVVPLRRDPLRKTRSKPHPIPERLSLDQVERIHRRLGKWGFSFEEIRFTIISVRAWSDSRGSAADRSDWVAVICNAARLGWGLRGFAQYAKRRGFQGRGKPVTDAKLTQLLDHLRSLGYE